jgi:hypothetical protein
MGASNLQNSFKRKLQTYVFRQKKRHAVEPAEDSLPIRDHAILFHELYGLGFELSAQFRVHVFSLKPID